MLKKLWKTAIALTFMLPLTHLAAQVSIETVTVHGQSLVGNLEGNSPDR